MQIPCLLTKIPDVVWSGLIASGLTLFGVTHSNWGNTRRLIKQMSHDSIEKERDRIHALRKDVYLKVTDTAAYEARLQENFERLDKAIQGLLTNLEESE